MAGRGNPPSVRPGGASNGGGIIIEIIPVGRMVRVIAVDAATGIETTIMGPANAARADLERVAVRKLRMMLARGSSAS